MIPCSQAVRAAIDQGQRPQALLIITTRGGQYIFSDQDVSSQVAAALGVVKADGSRLADNTWTGGGEPAVLGSGRKVKKWNSLTATLSSSGRDLKAGLTQNDPDNLTVILTNDADPPGPSIVGARAELKLVWPGVPAREGLSLFRGEVAERYRSKAETKYKLVSVSKGLAESLKNPIELKKASAYSNPASETAVLPYIPGNMTVGGSGGQWQAICIDKDTFVFALADHELDGGVELYDKDDNLIDSGLYTLNLADDFQGQGVIATATFAADPQDLEPIGVRAQGKPSDSGLPTNPVALARDLLLSYGGLEAEDLHGASWAKAEAVCEAQGYQAARAITSEAGCGDLLTGLLNNFVVYWWLGGDGKLRLLADAGPGFLDESAIVGHLDEKLMATADDYDRTADICNQLKVRYAPKGGDVWQGEDDGSSTRDVVSQQRHQVRLWDMDLAWVREAATANAIQQVRVARLGRARRRFSVHLPDCRLVHAERGDLLTVSNTQLQDDEGRPLTYQIVRIESIMFDPGSGGMDLGLLDTGYFLTVAHKADGSVKADNTWLGGGERKVA